MDSRIFIQNRLFRGWRPEHFADLSFRSSDFFFAWKISSKWVLNWRIFYGVAHSLNLVGLLLSDDQTLFLHQNSDFERVSLSSGLFSGVWWSSSESFCWFFSYKPHCSVYTFRYPNGTATIRMSVAGFWRNLSKPDYGQTGSLNTLRYILWRRDLEAQSRYEYFRYAEWKIWSWTGVKK